MAGSLVEDLLDPAAYPEPRPARVELRTTHGSWVFLTEDRAYKVKRPVDFGFMDFSTVDRRAHFCREELRLNRRLAPAVYLDVVPVYRDGARHSFVPRGDVVDYAVAMRRLPDARSAATLVASDRLGVNEIDGVARVLARFYAGAPAVPSTSFVADMERNVRENFHQVRPYVEIYVALDCYEAVERWQLDFLASRRDQLDARGPQGRLRDGHGDLRLEHVYLLDEGPAIIDAIEFNERFRCGDAALDVAFLAMDLDHALRPDLARWLLSRYALHANDYDFFGLVGLYLSYRAWVRGKVACFVAADASTPETKRQRKIDAARQLFELARSYVGPAPRNPAVVAVGGLIGAGKSTIADRLGYELGMPVASSDRTRKHLAGLAADAKGGDELYSDAMNRRTFDELFRRGRAVLEAGHGVVLDATFANRAMRARAGALAEEKRLPFLFVEARADEATLRRRLRLRGARPSVSDAEEALLEAFIARFEPATELAREHHLVVDTTRPLDRLVDAVRARLAEG